MLSDPLSPANPYKTSVPFLSPPSPFLSFLNTVRSMDFTFGGKYRLEEELAIGGCGPSSFLLVVESLLI